LKKSLGEEIVTHSRKKRKRKKERERKKKNGSGELPLEWVRVRPGLEPGGWTAGCDRRWLLAKEVKT